MSKVQFTLKMLERSKNKGKITLGEYLYYKGSVHLSSFFDLKMGVVTLEKIYLYSHKTGNYFDIPLEDFLKCKRINKKELKKLSPIR